MVPTSDSVTISHGGSTAVILGQGATLQSLVLDGHPILANACKVLAPWPNRLEAGVYAFDGTEGIAPITDPARMTANHGFVSEATWSVRTISGDAVTWQLDLDRQPKYPWRIHLEITYSISDSSLEVVTRVRNEDTRRAPFGIGFHADFATGPESVDGAVLEMQATTHLIVDERMLPCGSEPVAESEFCSLAEPGGLALRGVSLDDCFSDLGRDECGVAEIRYFAGATCPRLLIRCGPTFTHVTCFTADTRPGAARRQSMSIEPMTCPANALHTGDGIATIAPLGIFSCWFSVELAV